MTRRLLLAVALLLPSLSLAEKLTRLAIPTEPPRTRAGLISRIIYMERCRGGCQITKSSSNDAAAGLSTVPQSSGTKTVSEFLSKDGQPGSAADQEWNELLTCMREVYSPFDVEVTDVKPVGVTYHQAVVAGYPGELGFGDDILGVAPLATNCSPIDNVMSFSFANIHGPAGRVNNLCWTAAQESAHAFGLDHSFKFLDGRSTCNDPMTYQVDCGGQRFFRNQTAKCGEFNQRACKCGATQNSHQKLLSVFGPGTPITGNPTSAIVSPMGQEALTATIGAAAGSRRGVAKVELLVNGFPWTEAKGAIFGSAGQPNPSAYGLMLPAELPDGICDFVARAYDDLGAYTDSQVVTRTKGQPCVSSETCAEGQSCEAGKCLWPPSPGEVGDACEYDQYCKSLLCVGNEGSQICSQRCNPNQPNICPNDLDCIETGPDEGLCFHEDAGCCSVSGGRNVPWAYGGVSLLVIALVMRRRRRR